MTSTQIQTRRGTTAQHAAFTGASGELTVDTDKNTVVVHDGATAGGHPLAIGASTATEAQVVAAGAVTTIGDTDLIPNVQTTGPALKKITWLNLKNTLFTALGGLIAGGTSKGTPTSSDILALSDQAASSATKIVTIGNLFATLGAWVAALTGKTTPVAADTLMVADSAASNAPKAVTLTNFWTQAVGNYGPLIAALTAKATPVGADSLLLSDSAASGASKKSTLTALFGAIWTAWGGLIAGGTSKGTPTTSDLIAISDQAASSATKMLSIGNLLAILGGYIAGLTGKTTPVGADVLLIADSAASNANKGVTFTNLLAFIVAGITTFAKLAGNQTLTGGFDVTPFAVASWASFTVAPKSGNLQYTPSNTGSITITAPATDGIVNILITNGAGAVAPTLSGFSNGANTGDPYNTTSGNKMLLSVIRINGVSTSAWKALQ